MTEFEQKILEELQNLRGEISALRSNYSILQATYFDSLSLNSIVGVEYAAMKFNCTEAAVVRGRFDTDKIPCFRQKPLQFLKSDVDATFKQLTILPSEKAAQIRHKAKNPNNTRKNKKKLKNKLYGNEKAAPGATGNGLDNENLKINSPDFLAFSVEDYTKNLPVFQEALALSLSKNKRVRKLFRCSVCEKAYSLKKMTVCSALCRNCREELRAKGKVAQNNLIERAKSNIGKYLREVAK